MAKLFDFDPITKTKQLFHWHESDESFHIETLQDVSDIVETNTGFMNLHDERAPWKGDLHKVASIPMSVYMALPEGIRNDEKAFKRWLNDSAQKAFRTRPGKL